MRSIVPCLWFADDLEAALDFYGSVFPDLVVQSVERGPDGAMFAATFELAGLTLFGLNGGPHFRFTEAISLMIECDDQDEVDRLWGALTADGGEESQCGWCKDKFGLSWQVVPVQFRELMTAGTAEQSQRVMAAMMTMRKFDVAALQAAFEG